MKYVIAEAKQAGIATLKAAPFIVGSVGVIVLCIRLGVIPSDIMVSDRIWK